MRTGHVDLEALRRDRDQLWAEASAIEARGASLFLPERLWGAAGALQDERRDHDPWEDVLAADKGRENRQHEKHKPNHAGREGHGASNFTRGMCSISCYAYPPKGHDVTAKRVAFIMRRLGWDGPKVYAGWDDGFRDTRQAAMSDV